MNDSGKETRQSRNSLAYTRTVYAKPVTFRCQWCHREVTETRFPSHMPLYCSNPACNKEATRAKSRERTAKWRKANPDARRKKSQKNKKEGAESSSFGLPEAIIPEYSKSPEEIKHAQAREDLEYLRKVRPEWDDQTRFSIRHFCELRGQSVREKVPAERGADKCTIYQYSDPITQIIYYVGLSKNPNKRLKQHSADSKSSCYTWIKQLKSRQLVPTVKYLETCDDWDVGIQREDYWIRTQRPLLNIMLNKPVEVSA